MSTARNNKRDYNKPAIAKAKVSLQAVTAASSASTMTTTS
jgi:hypothetical protein